MEMSNVIVTCLQNFGRKWAIPFPHIFASFLYAIWLLKNKARFGGGIDVALTVKTMEDWVEEFMNSSKGKAGHVSNLDRKAVWDPPQEGSLAVNVDAAWREGTQLSRLLSGITRDRFIW